VADDFNLRVDYLSVGKYGKAQHDLATQPLLFRNLRIMLVCLQLLEDAAEVEVNSVLLLIGKALIVGTGDCRYEEKTARQSVEASFSHQEAPSPLSSDNGRYVNQAARPAPGVRHWSTSAVTHFQ